VGEVSFTIATDATQIYNPENDTWTLGAPIPTASIGLEAVVVDDVIFAIGGSHGWLINDYANEQYTPFGYGTVPPVIDAVSPRSQMYNESSVLLVFTVNKPVSWTGYSLDGQDNVTISDNTTLTGLHNGLHSLTVYANDTLGNMGASTTLNFNVKVPFPTAFVVAASTTSLGIIAVALLVYFKKRKR